MIPVFEEKEVAPIEKNDYAKANIQEENKGEAVIPSNEISPTLDIDDDEEDVLIEIPDLIVSRPNDDRILRYFNLYNSGSYIPTKDKPLEADFVIPIKAKHERGYLLQCYQSGHVNKVHVSVLLSRRIEKEYMNGLNKDGQLVHIQAIDSERNIGIYFNENGKRKFKARLTENLPCRENLHLQGYKVIYNDFKKIDYRIIPLEIQNKISRLVFQSFTAKGKSINNNYYESEWLTLKRFNIGPGDKRISNEPIQID